MLQNRLKINFRLGIHSEIHISKSCAAVHKGRDDHVFQNDLLAVSQNSELHGAVALIADLVGQFMSGVNTRIIDLFDLVALLKSRLLA